MKVKYLFMLLFIFFSYVAFTQDSDSLKQILFEANDTLRVNIYIELYEQYQQNDTSLALSYLDSAYQISFENNYDYGLINVINSKSTFLLKQGESQMALELLNQVFAIKRNKKLDKLFATTYNNIGLANYQLGSVDEAIKWHHKAVLICEDLNDQSGLARGFNNLGICYQKIENWEQALLFHKKSLEICYQLSILPGVAYNLGNIGIIQNNLHQYDSALFFHKKSLVINQQMNDRYQQAINHNNMAVVFESLQLEDSALQHHKRALEIRKEIGDDIGMITSLNDIAALKIEYKHNLEFAAQNLYEAMELAKKIKAKDYLRDTYLNLSKYYEAVGDLKMALESRKFFEAWKDSTVGENLLSRISELEMKYQNQKNENEILTLSRENLEKQAGLEKQEQLINLLIIGFIIVIVVAVLVFVIYKQSINYKNQKSLLKTITETQESERVRIARDLHDSVGVMLTAVKQRMDPENYNAQMINLVDEAASEVRRISHNMMPGALIKYGLSSAIEQLFAEHSKLLKTNLYIYGLENRLEVSMEIGIYRIIQELVQNIIRHAHAQQMTLHINRHHDYINIIMEDDGKGIDASAGNKEGIGLKNIKSRVNAWQGSLNIESDKTNGTNVVINIPIEND